MSELKGMCPIIATPFTKTGLVDYDSFENLIRVLIEGGCQAVTLFGIAGEYYKLTDDEMKRRARITVDTCHKYGGTSVATIEKIQAVGRTRKTGFLTDV